MKNTMKRITAGLLAAVLLVASVLNSRLTKTEAAPVNLKFYGLKETDYIKLRGGVTKEDIYFYRNDTNVNARDKYDSSIHTNDWYQNMEPAYCMDVNGAYPYGEEYESGISTLEESKRDDAVNLANLLKNSTYRKFWADNGVSSIGAQIEATQIAIWIITTNNGNSSRYPSDMSLWSGNTDKYSYEEVGNVAYMISKLIECYKDPSLDLCEPVLRVDRLGDTSRGEGAEQYYDFIITSKYCSEDITLQFTYTHNGNEYDGLPEKAKVKIGENLIENGSYTYNCYEGETKVQVILPRDLEHSLISVTLRAGTTALDNASHNICYYISEQKKDKFGDGNLTTVQEMLGVITARKNLPLGENKIEGSKFVGELIITKKNRGDEVLPGIRFSVYGDVEKTKLLQTGVTNELGQFVVTGLPGTTVYFCEEDNGEYADVLWWGDRYYDLGEVIPLTFNQDGTVTVDEHLLSFRTDYERAVYTSEIDIYNHKQVGILEIYKKGKVLTDYKNGEFVYEEKYVPAAVFGVYRDSLCTDEADVITTDDNGIARTKELPLGTYYVKELQAPTGHVLDTQVYLVELKDDDMTAEVVYGNKVVANENMNVSIVVSKVDANTKEPLSGAVFELIAAHDIYDYTGTKKLVSANEVLQTITSGEDGKATVTLSLPVNARYKVVERKAPAGYVVETTPYYIDGEWYNTSDKTLEFTYTKKNTKQLGRIEIFKTGEVLTGINLDNSNRVKSFVYEEKGVVATFGIYSDKACTNEVTRITTNANGVGISSQLELGTYYVKELVAAKNCVLDTNVYEVTLSYGNQTQSVVKETITINNKRKDIDVEVFKYVDGTTTPIEGATFSIAVDGVIKDYLGNTLFGTLGKTTVLNTVVTNASGVGAFALELPVGYEYVVKETIPAEGYVLNATEYRIEEAWKNESTLTKQYRFEVPNKTQVGQIKLTKTGNVLTSAIRDTSGKFGNFIFEDKLVSNAVFGVYTDYACTNEVAVLTTNAKGAAKTGDLPLGKYYVKEITAPVGCVLDTRVYTVELKYGDMTEEVVYENIALVNEKMKVSIEVNKTDAETKAPLSGAVFELIAVNDIYDYTGTLKLVSANEVLQTVTSGTDGKAVVTLPLPVNAKYAVVEKIAPTGYVVETTPYYIDAAWHNTSDGVLEFVHTLENKAQKGKIEIYKTGEILTDVKYTPEGEVEKFEYGLKGVYAEFGVYSDEQLTQCIDVIKTDKDTGYGVSKELELGTYYVKEIKTYETGVLDTSTHTVEITAGDDENLIIYETLRVENVRQKLDVSISKTQADTNEPVSGALFVLMVAEDICINDVLVKKGIIVERCYSDDKGMVNFTKDLPHGVYKILEAKPAPGYVDEQSLVQADLSYTYADTEKIVYNATVENDITKIVVAKKDSTGIKNQLAGAKFEIRDMQENVIHSFVTKDIPEEITKIPPGQYQLVEVESPFGFFKARPMLIQIENTGDVQYFTVIDEAIMGSLSYSYTENGYLLNAPDTSSDIEEVPFTGDKENMLISIIASVMAVLIIFLCSKKRKFALVTGMVVCILTMATFTVNAAETETKTVESDIIYDGQQYEFEEVLVQDGATYKLSNVEEVSLPDWDGRTHDVRRVFEYTGYTDVDIKETCMINVYDAITGTTKQVQLNLADVKINKTYWSDDFQFEIDVLIPGLYIEVAGEIVEYSKETPGLLKYEVYFLKEMGLSKDKYEITEIEWLGEEYIEDGIRHRKALAKGKKLVSEYTLTFEGTANLEDITGIKKYVATYEREQEPVTEEMENLAEKESESVAIQEEILKQEQETLTIMTKGGGLEGIFAIALAIIAVLAVVIIGLICYNIHNRKTKKNVRRK